MNHPPHGWAEVPLGKVASTQLGRMLSSRRETGDHAKPYLRNRDVQWGKIKTEDLPVMDFNQKNAAKFLLQPGDVLICEGGEVGRAAIWNGQLAECYYQKALHRVRPTADLKAHFLVYLLEHFARTRAFERYTSGSTIAHLPQEDLRNLPIPLPSSAAQDRIVAAIEEQFSRLDVGVAALNRASSNIKLLRSSVLSIVSEDMKSWVPLSDIADVIGGVTKDSKKQNDSGLVEVPYLRVANVQRGYLNLRQVARIRVPSVTAQKLRLETGDILFNEGGDRDKLGRGWVWEGQVPDCIHQNHVFRARLLGDNYDPKFISMHGNSFGRIWFDKNGKQTTNLASLSLTTLKSFPVPSAPIEKQQAIVAEVERRNSILTALEEEIHVALRRAASLRSSVLGAAFSGKLI